MRLDIVLLGVSHSADNRIKNGSLGISKSSETIGSQAHVVVNIDLGPLVVQVGLGIEVKVV